MKNDDQRQVWIALMLQEEHPPINLEITDAIVNRINQWYLFGIVEMCMFKVIEE